MTENLPLDEVKELEQRMTKVLEGNKSSLSLLDEELQTLPPFIPQQDMLLEVERIPKVEEYDRLKTLLLHMLGHDLKNSIHIIGGYADLLSMDVASGLPADPAYLAVVVQSLQRMSILIDETISVERLMSEGENRPIEQFDPREIANESIVGLQRLMKGKQQALVEDIRPGTGKISGIRFQLREVMINLIGNAIKYTPEGGQITVHASLVHQRFFFYVKDTGFGIPQALQAELFSRGYRANRPETRHIKGTGFGLSLVKNVIESHQGRVWFESVEGIGSTFGFFLPTALA